jgi:hypothetical protein
LNRFLVFLLLTVPIFGLAQPSPIKNGATVYIEPAGGYETYLAAAMVKQHVPLVIVTDKGKADYIVRSTVTQTTPSQPTVVVNNGSNSGGGYAAALTARGSASTSMEVIDPRSSQILFAYSPRIDSLSGTAEACAKHLKEFVAKQKK